MTIDIDSLYARAASWRGILAGNDCRLCSDLHALGTVATGATSMKLVCRWCGVFRGGNGSRAGTFAGEKGTLKRSSRMVAPSREISWME
jgi:hypothetical protein